MIVDAHEDIAWNILSFGRDYMRGVRALRETEKDTTIPARNGNALLGYDAWVAGQVGVIFATLFEAPARKSLGKWESQVYSTQEEANRLALEQMAVYRRLAEAHPFRVIETQADLASVLAARETSDTTQEHPIGLVILMEGADPVLEPDEAADWYQRGVRLIGPAWEATRYAGGTHEPGPLTADGERLLDVMHSQGMILDLTHLTDEGYYQAVDRYGGVMIASHANPRRFLPTSRGLSDEMIQLLAERQGVVGVVPYNRFLDANWKRGDPKEAVHLPIVADAIDHICQLTGSAAHVALGSDFDGGFGLEHVPAEIDTVADLAQLEGLLSGRGYAPKQISDIMGGNWLRVLRSALPA